MISRAHRFHGYGSLRHVYQNGSTARGPLFALKTLSNPRRESYRLAVVVSRKVEKSAVARNRMRRRLYAVAQELAADFSGPYDIVLTVFSRDLLDLAPEVLKGQFHDQLKVAGILANKPNPKK